ncbi:Uncharacterized protein OBRU01_20948 [Operophtera brumata]|uniref:Nuclease HARBI1 n=1 Tax=Operophtera brumata TaxID=104452 RepID=A0A0L7KTK0_OPEBR|nr:Uncharacterized protein OBRU01_20948 [Operophtera brumata]
MDALAFDERFDEDDFISLRTRWMREREEHFDSLHDKDFDTRFRLTKPTVLSVLKSIEDKIEFPTNMTRNCIERFYGVWKRRFPCMAIGLGVSLENSFQIVIATAVLLNIARRSGEATPPDDSQVINLCIIFPASWDALLAHGNINNGKMDTGRTQRTNPNYRRRCDFVTNYFAQLAR